MNRPKVHIIRTNLFIRKGFAAITLGNRILVRPDMRLDEYLLAHELMHVLQWKKYGVVGFLWRYGWTWVRDGFSYHNIDLEEEARTPTVAVRVWARELIAEAIRNGSPL